MPRVNRVDVGNQIYHVLNRANARVQIFDNDEDYRLFESVLEEAKEKFEVGKFSRFENHYQHRNFFC